MLNNISWSEYWTTLGIIAFIYYVVIALIYYSEEVKHVLSGDLIFVKTSKIDIQVENEKSSIDNGLALINRMKQEITMTLKQAHENNSVKQEVLYSLQAVTKKFSTIKETAFESDINHYIQSECSNYCSIHLDGDEIDSVWVK